MNKPLILIARMLVAILIISQTATAQLIVLTESFDPTTFTPTGWSLNPNPGVSTAVWTRRTNGNTQLAMVPHSGAAMASFRSTNFGNPPGTSVSGDFQSLITPMFDLSSRGAAIASVSFWMFRDSLLATNEDSLSVYINTTDSLSGASWIGTVVRNNSIAIPNAELINGWYMYTFYYPSSFTGATNYILFKGVAEQGARIYLDDVSYDTYPLACSGVPFVGNILNPFPIICNGGGSTILSLEFPQTGIGGLVYDWQMSSSATGPWSNVGTGADTLNTPNLTTTTYFQCIVNCISSGFSDTTAIDSVIVSANINPTISVAGTTTFCQGSNSLLVASGALTYSWIPLTSLTNVGETDMDSVLAAPIVNTTYIVIGTDLNGCAGSSNVIVTINPAPVLNATAYAYSTNTVLTSTIICLGDSLRINAIPFGGGNPWTYLWSDGATTRIDSILPLVTSTYVVTATVTATGCTANDTIVITVNSGAPPVISISPNGPISVCNGVGVQIIASGATDYLWTPTLGLNTATNDTVIASPTASTMYIVSGTNPGSCVAKDTIQINAGISPNATAAIFSGNDTICTNTEIILQAGPIGGANSFIWNDGAVTGNDTLSPISSGEYSVTVTNAIGCSDTASIFIFVQPGTSPTISISPIGQLTSCDGSPVQITASGTGTNYSWSPSTGLDANTGTIVNASPTATTNNTITSVLGSCSAFLTFTVLAGNSPVLNATAYDLNSANQLSDSICGSIGDVIRLNAIPFGGNNPWSYLWNNGHTVRIDTVVLTATTTTYTVMATNNLTGCIGYDTIVITLIEPPVANFSFTNNGNNYSFNDLSTGSINSWSWNFGDGNNASSQNPNYTYTAAGTYIVKLVINGQCGVDSSEQTIVIDGISNINSAMNVACYPNPATDEVNLSLTSNDAEIFYSVVDVLGQEL
ncbi:MAG: PKD domain-containing protein, partial [Bacteroidota bacterium]